MRAIKQNDIIDVIYDTWYGLPLEEADKVVHDYVLKKLIPIEWIKAWGDHFINEKGYYTGDGYDTIWDMLEEWEGIECEPGMTRSGCIKENVK